LVVYVLLGFALAGDFLLEGGTSRKLREMEILKIPLTTPPAFTPHPHPSLPPLAGEGVETPSLARAACGGGLGRGCVLAGVA